MRRFSGQRLAELRKQAGLRQEHIAVGVDRSFSTVRLYETGGLIPPTAIIERLAELLQVEPGAFFVSVDDSDVVGAAS